MPAFIILPEKDNFLAGDIKYFFPFATINCLLVKNRTAEKNPRGDTSGAAICDILPFPLDLLLPEPEEVGCGLVDGVTDIPTAATALLLLFSGGLSLSTTLKAPVSREARLRRFSRTELTSPRGDTEDGESSQLFRETTSTFSGGCCSGEF